MTPDVGALPQSIAFALSGAAVSVGVGGGAGLIAGTLDYPGRRSAVALSAALIAAPPAFWWIGCTRFPIGSGGPRGAGWAAIVAGVALAPITLLLVLAASREIPSDAYQAARLSLGPMRRVWSVLVPLVRPALVAGFLLTAIVLLGESEIPFLFGFRTSMTDIVTTFSQTFDARRTVPIIAPLVVVVLLLGLLLVRPLFRVILPGPKAGRGVVRMPAGLHVAAGTLLPPFLLMVSLSGYARAAVSGGGDFAQRISAAMPTLGVSIAEPVLCAAAAVGLALLFAYPTRRSVAIRTLAIAGLMLFCVPAAVTAIAWIAAGQALGISFPPGMAHVSRLVGLAIVGFLVGYARLPESLEQAAQLVPLSPFGRAWRLVVPPLYPSLAATAALAAALVFADRDVAALLLAPGDSRLMLNLYLLSANARSAAVGATALIVFAAGGAVIALSAAVPAVVFLRRRGE